LRLTLPAFLATSDLVDRIAAFGRAHEKVRLSVDFADSVRDLIADGFDMAIRVGGMKDSALKAQKLSEVRRLLVGSPEYLAQQSAPTSPQDLTDWQWIELAPVWHIKPEFRRAGHGKQVVKRDARISVNNATAFAHMVRAGAGIGILPESVVGRDIADGELVHLLPEWQTFSLNIYAVWPANAPKDGLIKRLVRFLHDAEGGQG